MASLLETLAALATAGTMMISSSLDAAAPQNDVDGFLFLQNRQWLASRAYEPETVTADVPGQIRQMRQEAALALEEMFDACKKDIGITLKAVSGYRSYARQETIYNNKLERVHGSVEKADEYVARPGASEHQTGLVMDVGQKSDKVNLTGGFGATKGGKWVAGRGSSGRSGWRRRCARHYCWGACRCLRWRRKTRSTTSATFPA